MYDVIACMCTISVVDIISVSIDWLKGNITGQSHISWENLWFPVDFPLSQPIDQRVTEHVEKSPVQKVAEDWQQALDVLEQLEGRHRIKYVRYTVG